MTNLNQLRETLSQNLLSTRDQVSLKGKGMGNMMKKLDKNCPPPVEEGKMNLKDKFY